MIISIHALLAESDGIGLVFLWWGVRFLSTLSLRRATLLTLIIGFSGRVFLSTLSLRRATTRRASRQQPAGISIHALLAESDNRPVTMHTWKKVFLSTLSLRRATPRGGPCYLDNIISIHALLAESDQKARPNCQSK